MVIGLELAAALLLGAAGLSKLRRPGPARSALTAARLPGATRIPARWVNRGAGLAELALALAAFLLGGRLAGVLLALAFGSLAAVSARMVRVDRGQDCGCFAKPTPISHWHTVVNAAMALVGLVTAVHPARALPTSFAAAPATGSALVLGAALLAYLAYLSMTALPELLTTAADLEAAR